MDFFHCLASPFPTSGKLIKEPSQGSVGFNRALSHYVRLSVKTLKPYAVLIDIKWTKCETQPSNFAECLPWQAVFWGCTGIDRDMKIIISLDWWRNYQKTNKRKQTVCNGSLVLLPKQYPWQVNIWGSWNSQLEVIHRQIGMVWWKRNQYSL